MNNFTNKRLCLPVAVPASSSVTIYTVPANTVTIISVLTYAHTAPASGSINTSLYLCPNDVPPSASNALLYDIPVDPDNVVNFNFGQAIHETDTIKVVSNMAGLVLHVTGIEIT
jgi:hypothetical protein